jgi:hypothetical protein
MRDARWQGGVGSISPANTGSRTDRRAVKGRHEPPAVRLGENPDVELSLWRYRRAVPACHPTNFIRHVCHRHVGCEKSDPHIQLPEARSSLHGFESHLAHSFDFTRSLQPRPPHIDEVGVRGK